MQALRFSLTQTVAQILVYWHTVNLFTSEILSLLKVNKKVLAFSHFSQQSNHAHRIAEIGKKSVGRVLLQLVHGVLA